MVGLLATRAQFGLILPSTNTSVEAEFNRMLVPGVSWHSGRIFAANPGKRLGLPSGKRHRQS